MLRLTLKTDKKCCSVNKTNISGAIVRPIKKLSQTTALSTHNVGFNR